tara:strand:+ start:9725 stop:10036 length:312 start_codon:yes stop_codon:yes gene_type:complete
MLRNPNSIPVGDILIQDPVMEPFFITKSQSGGYTVYERVEKGEKNTKYIKTISYPSSFNQALLKVSNELLNYGEVTTFNSIQEYVQKWQNIQKQMTSLTSIDL